MSQDGYTLAETMAALVMIGLAIGGLGQASYLIARLSHATSAHVGVDLHRAAAQRTLDGLLAQSGPFHDQDREGFRGSGASFVFPCGSEGLCGAELVAQRGQTRLVIQRGGRATASRSLGALNSPRFSYRDTDGMHTVWPAPGDADGRAQGDMTLDAVALIEGRSEAPSPVAVTAVWAQQPAVCQFDSISGACREIGP